ncbi:MAG: PTS sugar transporter subunit IIA [Planctomycetota bacterium]
MNLKEILPEGSVIPEMTAQSRDEAIEELLDALVRSEALVASLREEALVALLKREASGSTCIAAGLAIPHARLASLRNCVGALGRCGHGVEFESGGQPVRTIFLFLSPEQDSEQHLELIQWIGRIGQNPRFLQALHAAKTASSIRNLMTREEDDFKDDLL